MVVFTEVSSMKTRLDESSRPCSRIQRRRARTTSARSCSAARRLFFEADLVALEEAPDSGATARYPLSAHLGNDLIQRPILSFGVTRRDTSPERNRGALSTLHCSLTTFPAHPPAIYSRRCGT